MRKVILTIISIFVFYNFIIASNWVGGVGNWSVAANWNPVGVPTASDDVTIYSGEVTVDIDAFAKSIVLGNASLTIGTITLTIKNSSGHAIRNNGGTVINNGIINISDNISFSGIYNEAGGGFTNHGEINISNTGSATIDNRDLFINESDGTISLNSGTQQGIYNYNNGDNDDFQNAGIINIANSGNITGNGIQNEGKFTNTNIIYIGSLNYSVGGRGIFNIGEFYNNNIGDINIDNVNSYVIQNTGTFECNDNSKIDIGYVAACANTGIYNSSSFSLASGSELNVKDIATWGAAIKTTTGGLFTNYGTINHMPVSSYVIDGDGGSVINKSTGKMFSGKAINGNYFTNEGSLNPGNSPGKLQINNNYYGNTGSKLNIEIGGTTPETEYDQLNFQNLATDDISNTDLVVTYINGYTPSGGESFDIIIGNGYLGEFNSITRPTAPVNYHWVDTYNATTYTMSLESTVALGVISFDAKSENEVVYLSWKTTNEIEAEKYEIERSFDLDEWQIIGQIESKNNRDETSYSFIDEKTKTGDHYYRLKQVNSNGDFEYSQIVSVVVEGMVAHIYPNPAKNYIYIENSRNSSSVTAFDLKGDAYILPRISENTYNTSLLISGMYYIKSIGNKVIKFMKM